MDCAALILAGGSSRRMGQDKALLELDSEPLIARTSRVAAAVGDSVWLCSPQPDRYLSWLPQTVHCLTEPQPSGPQGPLTALAWALPQIKADWVLLLACDLPRLAIAPLQAWRQQVEPLPEDCLAAIARTEQGWEPLVGFYRPAIATTISPWLAQGRRDFQGWLNSIAVAELALGDRDWLVNCNTPADWQALQLS
ncbi:molybdenum cofactor guanylyltransferase [Synechococcus elongatus]|uniref:Probable molybdenum cofactor guanylyltransferase n=1 Tax=Synechococcus elongatus PCC 11802 TaxID=2283154 RepID=A0AAU6R5R6_SYNEL|nr:molybdenum cofactor guanylyltransferase [Synechococcus elongatus]QFZ93394.1 molybdenum cofactor guanylyltransferase [Synechococcus elongatus PCC 11802]